MPSFAASLKAFLAVEPCDMRKGFNGLPSLVSERLQENPQAGALFVFLTIPDNLSGYLARRCKLEGNTAFAKLLLT